MLDEPKPSELSSHQTQGKYYLAAMKLAISPVEVVIYHGL